jgi:hypothetical protein
MVTKTNPYDIEFRETRDGRLVIWNNRKIAKVTQNGVLMSHATEVARSAAILDSLGLAKAMFVVETESQLQAVLQWTALREFTKLTLNLYFIPDPDWFRDTLREAAPRLQHLESLQVTGAVPLPALHWNELDAIFSNIEDRKLIN